MKLTHLLAGMFLLFATASFGQSNTCAYSFSFPKYSFQFCLTSLGTLAQLQNDFDPVNPIEGWSWNLIGFDREGHDFYIVGCNIPAYSWCGLSVPVVTQPNGPGTLPIQFSFSSADFNSLTETVTAVAAQRKIIFQVSGWKSSWLPILSNLSKVYRVASLNVSGTSTDTFDVLGNSAFAYVSGSQAVFQGGVLGYGHSCVVQGEWGDLLGSGPPCATTLPYIGYGTIVTEGFNYARGVQVTTYQVF